MKHFYFSLLLLCAPIFLQAQSPQTYLNDRGQTHLLSSIDRQDLNQEPYKEWMDTLYKNHTISEEGIASINKYYNDNLKVKIFLGTWCGDSKREVSKFLKIADNSAINQDNISLICLDDRRPNYKQSPDGQEADLNIHRVPTFIFYDGDEEVGRIVEEPVNSLETDIAQIYAGIPTKPSYRLANEVGKLLHKKPLDEAKGLLTEYQRYYSQFAHKDYELTTLGSVLVAADELEKALAVFHFNTELFPDSGYARYGLGRAYMLMGHNDEAIDCFNEAIELGGDNGYSKMRIKEMVDTKETP